MGVPDYVSSTALGVEGFLKHSSRGGGGSVLQWRSKTGGTAEVDVWLHRKASLAHSVWRHSWFDVVEVEDSETKEKVKKVFRRPFVCHERELICKKRNFRDKKTGEREYPPDVCPIDFMIEDVLKLVRTGKIAWTDTVFRFEGSDPDSEWNVELTAAGIYGGYRGELTKEQIKELRKAGIRRDEVWSQDLRAKLSYLFSVVADPTDGMQVAIETELLGNKFKTELGKRLKVKGRDLGDPQQHPYPFNWKHDPDAQINDAYEVTALEKQPTEEILKLIDGPAPKLDVHLEPGNCLWLYHSMIEACVLEEGLLNFDSIFQAAKEAGLMKEKPKVEEVTDAADDADPPEVEDGKPELYDCDHCGAATMTDTGTECSNCGAGYGENGDLNARPCNECRAVIKLEGEGPRFICPKCASIHEQGPKKKGTTASWTTFKKGAAPATEAKPSRKRSEAKQEGAEAYTQEELAAQAQQAKAAKPAKAGKRSKEADDKKADKKDATEDGATGDGSADANILWGD